MELSFMDPPKGKRLNKKKLKILAMLCIFFSLILVYRISGLPYLGTAGEGETFSFPEEQEGPEEKLFEAIRDPDALSYRYPEMIEENLTEESERNSTSNETLIILEDNDSEIEEPEIIYEINLTETIQNNSEFIEPIQMPEYEGPQNLVLIIIDGVGWIDFSEDTTPYILELSKHGFRAENMQARTLEKFSAHSTLLTSRFEPDFDASARRKTISFENSSLMDIAGNYSFGILGENFTEVIEKMDASLYISENFTSDLNYTETLPKNLKETFENADNLSNYTTHNDWIRDSANSILFEMNNSNETFTLIVNFPEFDSETDKQVYEIFETLLETSLLNRTILAITATSKTETNVPFILVGPTIESKISKSTMYTEDITLTLAEIFNFSKPINSNGNLIKSIFTEIHDLEIINVENSELIEQTKAKTTVFLQNLGEFPELNYLCINISSEDYSTKNTECYEVNLDPEEEKEIGFMWAVSSNGTYNLEINLPEDDNPYGKRYSERLHAGEFSDLSIGDAWYTKTNQSNNNSKAENVSLTIKVCNLGNLKEDSKLQMNILLENCSSDYCDKTYNKNFEAAPGNCNNYKQGSSFELRKGEFQNITFQILNYSAIEFDVNEGNNIKTITTYLS